MQLFFLGKLGMFRWRFALNKRVCILVGRTVDVIERKHDIKHAHVNNFRLLFWFNYNFGGVERRLLHCLCFHVDE